MAALTVISQLLGDVEAGLQMCWSLAESENVGELSVELKFVDHSLN